MVQLLARGGASFLQLLREAVAATPNDFKLQLALAKALAKANHTKVWTAIYLLN